MKETHSVEAEVICPLNKYKTRFERGLGVRVETASIRVEVRVGVEAARVQVRVEAPMRRLPG